MGWKEARSRYQNKIALTEQKVEDLVARRVLQGLGLTEKRIWDAERAVFGGLVKDDQALWVRVLALLRAVWREEHIQKPTNATDITVLRADIGHRNVLKYIDEILAQKLMPPTIMARLGSTTQSYTYSYWRMDQLDVLLPGMPFFVLKKFQLDDHSFLVVAQETATFVAQFGPYRWLPRQLENERGGYA